MSEVEKSTPADVENQQAPSGAAGGGGGGVSEILGQWKREDLMKRGCVALRGFALLFSFLSLVIMASNKHGDGKDFDQYEEYRYVLAIAVLSFLYAGAQSLKHIHQLSTGKTLIDRGTAGLIDFFGDQLLLPIRAFGPVTPPLSFSAQIEEEVLQEMDVPVVAYLLISSASAAIPMTNRIREGADNIFTDSCSSSISMSFFAFLSLAFSAMIAGYKLSTNTL